MSAFAAVLIAASLAAPPKVLDDRLQLELILEHPDIATPTGIAVTEEGLVLVVENNTHFRPKDYPRAPHDRILALKDTNGDGKPDQTTVFFEGTKNTMNLAVHFNGGIYVATRSEIFRLTDKNKDGKADQSLDDRETLVRLETKGDYPHNGLSGFAFDLLGNVYFGFGENLGAAYKLIGKDNVTLEGGGEGGNVYSCTADGSKLWQVATGFWNPFHLGFDRFGRLFAVDNDPDSRPPCRLLHIVPGGDYGFKFRNGRKGVHPFTSWNGELPGTLPMVAGTGEAPCAVLAYESDQLPEEYRGELLVTSWGDHRLERYRLRPRGVSFQAEVKPLIVGDENFRPVGLALAPDGSLYMSDWVDKSYQLHGKGRVWKLSAKNPPKLSRPEDPKDAIASPHGPLREAAARKMLPDELKKAAHADEPVVRSLARRAIARTVVEAPGEELSRLLLNANEDKLAPKPPTDLNDPFFLTQAADGITNQLRGVAFANIRAQRLQEWKASRAERPEAALILLLAYRAHNEVQAIIPAALESGDPRLIAAAILWIGERRLTGHRPQLEAILQNTKSRQSFELALAALDLLDLKPGDKVNETAGSDYVLKLLNEGKSSPEILRLCLRMISAQHAKLNDDLLAKLVAHEDPGVRSEAIRTWRERGGDAANAALSAIAKDAAKTDAERAEAMIGLNAETHRDLLTSLAKSASGAAQAEAARALRTEVEPAPPATDAAAWLRRLEGPGDAAAGERLFFHPKFATCFRCHEHEGRGAAIGPDLTAIGGTFTREKLLQSLLEPSREIGPRYTPQILELDDGRIVTGLYTGEEVDGTLLLADTAGKTLRAHPRDIVDRKPSAKSIMPDGLLATLTPQEARDLFAFLLQAKAR